MAQVGPSLGLPSQLPRPSLGLPSQLPGPSLYLPVQLRNKILSYLPLWQLERWDQAEQDQNCRPHLPASAQNYSQLFSRNNVFQQLQLRFDLDAERLRRWYNWLFKSVRQLDRHQRAVMTYALFRPLLYAPLLTPMQALSKIAMYFGQVGENVFMANDKPTSLMLLLAQLQVLDGTTEMSLYRRLLLQGGVESIPLIYVALQQQSLEVLRSYLNDNINLVYVPQLIPSYYPSRAQMELVLSYLSKLNKDNIRAYLGSVPVSYDITYYWHGLMARACNVAKLDIRIPIGKAFASTAQLALSAEQLKIVVSGLIRLYREALEQLDYFSLVQLDFIKPNDFRRQLMNFDSDFPTITCMVITEQKFITIPLLRQWVVSKLSANAQSETYLLLLDILEGQEITYPLTQANFPVLNQINESEFLAEVEVEIISVAGPNVAQAHIDMVDNKVSDRWYDVKQLQLNPEVADLANCWRIGQQFNFCDYPTLTEQKLAAAELASAEPEAIPTTLTAEPTLPLTLPEADLLVSATADITGAIFRSRLFLAAGSNVTASPILIEKLAIARTNFGRNIVNVMFFPEITSAKNLRQWLDNYPDFFTTWAQKTWNHIGRKNPDIPRPTGYAGFSFDKYLARAKSILRNVELNNGIDEATVHEFIARYLLRTGDWHQY